MSVEPSADNIDFFLSITNSVSKSDAVKWLKKYNNDVNNACNAYFEDPNGLDAWDNTGSQTWDDSVWGQGKEPEIYGPQNRNDNVPSFTVNSEDVLHSAPPPFEGMISRPPSRVSNLGLGDKPTGQSNQQTAKEREEDAQMAQAMEMSLRNTSGQESGVIDASGTTFGPATQAAYSQKEWGMTRVGSAQEILLNPEAQYRKREPGAPAFIRPNPAGDHLPALITILHAIPMAREALILRDYTQPDYGHHPEWWDGFSIQTPKILNLDRPEEHREWEDLIYESQRLMAFLDGTERAYGSAEALSHVEGLAWSSESIESTFLRAWKEAAIRATSESELTNVFETTAFFTEENEKSFDIIDLSTPFTAERGYSIYDVFDDAFYFGLSHTDEAYLTKVADVLIIHVDKNSSSLSGHGMRVPSTFYPDRYLQETVHLTRQMRKEKQAVKEEIERIKGVQEKMTSLQRPNFQNLDAKDLLEATMTYLQSTPTTAGPRYKSIDDKVAAYSKLAAELQGVAERIQRKYEELEEAKAQALDKLRDLSKLLTKPSEDVDLLPNKKYTLRGVSTNHNTTYVLEKTRPDDENDLFSAEASDWQWWKIHFSSGDTKPITYTKVREVEVMKAAKDESASALLVYASEKAVLYETQAPSQQLQNFVRVDNLDFDAELGKATASQGFTSPKRKAEESYDETDDANDINWGGYQSTSSAKQVNGFSAPGSNEDTDDTLPPPYTPSTAPAPPPRSAFSRSSAYKTRNVTSYDDMVPTSLQATGPLIDSASTSLDEIELDEKPVVGGQEMKEKGSGLGMTSSGFGGASQEASGGYKLGSYIPEINMDEVDEGFVEGGKGG